MRNVTIKRHKAFTGCLMKVKVYVEDARSSELLIGGVPCRKLGELKSGEEKTFLIEEEAVKLFVIGDKLTKEYCVDCYPLPAGQEDIVLSGKNKYNLSNGHAFRFDNNDSEEAALYRKKTSKKGIVVMCLAIVIGAAIGFLSTSGVLDGPASPRTFTADGISITLTDEFVETSYDGFHVCYETRDAAVFVVKEDFSLYEGLENFTLEQYGEVLLYNADESGYTVSEPVVTEDRFRFQYDCTIDADSFTYDIVTLKGTDAFWIVEFVTLIDDYETYSSLIEEWAATITLI